MKKVQIDYLCQHLSCRMACKEGTVIISNEDFINLREGSTEAGCMRSPSKVCKIGHTQDFKILSKEDYKEKSESEPEVKVIKTIDINVFLKLEEKVGKLEEENELLKQRVLGLEQSTNELLKKKTKKESKKG